MTFVVTEACIKCKYTDCVEVCPVDCFHEGPNMLVIDPEECIDCTLCEPECPVEAIVSEDDVPPGQEQFLARNAELAKEWPVITKAQALPDDADEWKDVQEKLAHLERCRRRAARLRESRRGSGLILDRQQVQEELDRSLREPFRRLTTDSLVA